MKKLIVTILTLALFLVLTAPASAWWLSGVSTWLVWRGGW